MVTMAGARSTPMALTDSQNKPSEVDALPMVAKTTSSPLCEKSFRSCNSFNLRYKTDAYASPTARGICAAVGETSLATLYIFVWECHVPLGYKLREAKCAFICRPALAGS